MSTANRKKAETVLLRARGLSLESISGRILIDGLNLTMSEGDRVAIIGRNGVGKSTLLDVLAGDKNPASGDVYQHEAVVLIRQHIDLVLGEILDQLPASATLELKSLGLPSPDELRESQGLSRGQWRKLSLLNAKYSSASLLLLDEPSQDLDTSGKAWLCNWLGDWSGSLLVVSHDSTLLREFQHFFIVAESGCRYLPGTFAELQESLQQEAQSRQREYSRNLNRLAAREEHNAIVRRRRHRKKMGGRVREIDRAPSRAMLNAKRSYAQESQGKRAKLQEARIGAVRRWTKATRRALEVSLPLTEMIPVPPDTDDSDIVVLQSVCVRDLLGPIDIRLRRQRIAITGGNGSGKTTLLQIMQGMKKPCAGHVLTTPSRIGSIEQGGANWMLEESLLSILIKRAKDPSPDALASRLVGHRFPLALAERPLESLSPGERVRAALLCIFEAPDPVELLILDEPTYSLDFVGAQALREVLCNWQGGLVVVSHDRDFLKAIGTEEEIRLGS